ncbi:MAG: DNA-3-methyladenine glycosylase family protein [Oligosphaeraceae bacterium]
MPESFFPYGEKEIRHLQARDPRLGEIMERLGPLRRTVDRDLYSAILHQILAQQISNKALATVWRRLEETFGAPTPRALAAVDLPQLQALGMSRQKGETIRRVTDKFLSGEWTPEALARCTDQEAIARFSSLKGIGVWTAEMILLFGLRRPDILSYRDLGIQRGMRMVYRHPVLTPALFQRHRRRLSPYASVASLYFWAVAGGALPELADPAPSSP